MIFEILHKRFDILCSLFDLYALCIWRKFYVSCIGCYIRSFAWNLLLLSVDIICWNWKIYISFSWVGFGFFLDLECMSDPCCFESFFAWGNSCFLLHADLFQCLVGKIGSSFPRLFQREVLVFSLLCFIRKRRFSSCFVHD